MGGGCRQGLWMLFLIPHFVVPWARWRRKTGTWFPIGSDDPKKNLVVPIEIRLQTLLYHSRHSLKKHPRFFLISARQKLEDHQSLRLALKNLAPQHPYLHWYIIGQMDMCFGSRLSICQKVIVIHCSIFEGFISVSLMGHFFGGQDVLFTWRYSQRVVASRELHWQIAASLGFDSFDDCLRKSPDRGGSKFCGPSLLSRTRMKLHNPHSLQSPVEGWWTWGYGLPKYYAPARSCKSFELTKAFVRNEAFGRLAVSSPPTVALPKRPSLMEV